MKRTTDVAQLLWTCDRCNRITQPRVDAMNMLRGLEAQTWNTPKMYTYATTILEVEYRQNMLLDWMSQDDGQAQEVHLTYISDTFKALWIRC